jgi:SHS2 domain-containing protein
MMEQPYREVPHTADLALEVWGRDLPELYAHAAAGLFDQVDAVAPAVQPTSYREVTLSDPDSEILLVDWLNELLDLADENHEAYVTFDVAMPQPTELRARVGATRDFAYKKVVKAATFHDLAIQHDESGYRTVIVFDV